MFVTRRRTIRLALVAASSAGLALAGPGPVAATGMTVPEPEPEPLPPAVLAQQVVALPAGDYSWAVDDEEDDGVTPGGGPLTFIIGTGGPFTVADSDGVARYLLAGGEVAVMTAPFGAIPAEGESAELVAISLFPNGDVPFPVTEGLYDAELLRIDLDPGEIAEIADPGQVPMLLFAPQGGLIVTSDAPTEDGGTIETELTLEAYQSFEGSLTVISAGLDDVIVLAARVSPVGGVVGGEAPETAPPPSAG
jgi:hypothetical protein